MAQFSREEFRSIDNWLALNERGECAELIEVHKSGEKSLRDMNDRRSANHRRRMSVERSARWREKKPAQYRRYMKSLMRSRRLAFKHLSASDA